MSGDDLKHRGQEQVEGNSEGWVQKMREVAVKIVGIRGSVSSDDLRRYALKNGLQPHHPNAWGAIFRGTVEGMKWVEIGRKKSAKKSNHGRKISVWTLQ